MKKNSIQEEIKLKRKSKGMTQQELADLAGISLRTLQRIEKGHGEISGYSIKQISRVLDIPVEELILSHVESINIETNSIESIKQLYWLSLLCLLNPILGFIAPWIAGSLKQNKNELYRKNYRFILIFHSIVPSLYIIALISLIITAQSSNHFIGTQELIILFITSLFFNFFYFIISFIVTLFKISELNKIKL